MELNYLKKLVMIECGIAGVFGKQVTIRGKMNIFTTKGANSEWQSVS